MPYREIVAKELAELLSVLAHPNRIRIVERLRKGEHDVNALQSLLGISHSGVSQHLMVLRARRVVAERREGRRVFYHLRHPHLADWLTEAMQFLQEERDAAKEFDRAIAKTHAAWAGVKTTS